MKVIEDVKTGEKWFLETLVEIMEEVWKLTGEPELIDAISIGKIEAESEDQRGRFGALSVFVRKELSGNIKPCPPSLKLLYKEITENKD